LFFYIIDCLYSEWKTAENGEEMVEASFTKKLNSAQGFMNLEVNFKIEKGSFTSLYGKSGAGKTSILRILAGLLRADTGSLKVANEVWFDKSKAVFLRPQNRKIGLLFQDYILFPNMTVKENISFALSKNQNINIIAELIETMELGNLENKKPHLLSGGQQQRVALARALVQKPQLLLLDEPLSALGQEMRVKLQDYILEVHQRYNLTTILVSHNRREVLKMADNIIHLDNGEIINQGTAATVFPQNKLKLIGKIIAVYPNEIRIQIGEDYLIIPIEKLQKKDLSVGDSIDFEVNL